MPHPKITGKIGKIKFVHNCDSFDSGTLGLSKTYSEIFLTTDVIAAIERQNNKNCQL